jgi:hypothetical protein
MLIKRNLNNKISLCLSVPLCISVSNLHDYDKIRVIREIRC